MPWVFQFAIEFSAAIVTESSVAFAIMAYGSAANATMGAIKYFTLRYVSWTFPSVVVGEDKLTPRIHDDHCRWSALESHFLLCQVC